MENDLFADEWKKANLVPFHKKGDKKELKIFRTQKVFFSIS